MTPKQYKREIELLGLQNSAIEAKASLLEIMLNDVAKERNEIRIELETLRAERREPETEIRRLKDAVLSMAQKINAMNEEAKFKF